MHIPRWAIATAAACTAWTSLLAQSAPTPRSFATRANMSVDSTTLVLSTAIATVEADPMAAGFSWIRVYFYAFPLGPDDVASVTRGSVVSMDKKWQREASRPRDYNTSRAVVQLTVDRRFKIVQADMSIPGHTCTIASTPRELGRFAQRYELDGERLRLASTGSYICDRQSLKLPAETFRWSLDVDIPAFAKARGGP